MQSVVQKINEQYKKPAVVDVRSGDTVKVHQKIREGSKERVQVFQGLVIRTDRKGSHTSRITVRRIASGVGVEKSFLLHSPLVVKVEVTKRSKVRRNYLSYMRARTGKAARLANVDFDKDQINNSPAEVIAAVEAKKAEEQAKASEVEAKKADTTDEVSKTDEPKTDKQSSEVDKADKTAASDA
jgi:large subunit ribosomal protein L19